jgi:hypothetical protein
LLAVLGIAFTMPAFALENVFGGYWRTRGYVQRDFTGNEDETMNKTLVDTRSRLFYTAIFNENLKFINAFEFNSVWGNSGQGGGIGTDGNTLVIKHSYADFNAGPVGGKVGLQPGLLGRGFLFDDDFAGVVLSFNVEGFTLPVIWMRPYEDSEKNKNEVDYFAVAPTFGNETLSITPFGLYAYSNNANDWEKTKGFDKLNMYYAGVELGAKMGPASLWGVGIYQGGSADLASDTTKSVDFKAWLAGAGANVDFGFADVHGQAFYATGDDKEDANESKTFFVPQGQSYYWSEIMGYGIFDNQVSKNACADQIGNIMAANIGTTIKPMDDLSISLDAWYAKLAEGNYVKDGSIVPKGTAGATQEDELGIEANVKISYKLVEGLNLDLIGAYLFAGDATTMKAAKDKNPYEVGTQLSLSF